jgi:anthranilate synthase component 1
MQPNPDTYRQLAAEYDVIPVARERLADRETPVSVLARFAHRPNVFLLESMEGGEKWGRYSFIGVDPAPWFEAGHARGPTGTLETLRKIYRDRRVAVLPGLPRFVGGAVGFIGYEAVGEFERLPMPKPADPDAVPLSAFVQADRVIVFDNIRHTLTIVISTRPREFASPMRAYEQALVEIEAIEKILREPPPPDVPKPAAPVEFVSNLTADEFRAMVSKAREYIHAGDVIQVVLSQRFRARTSLDPVTVYRALRFLNPSPYTFFLRIGGRTLAGSSPEVMVRLTGNRVELRPIAGTRPRGATEQRDRELADELLADEKERAEHVMLVDLGRNDLGRISETGSVQVTDYMVVERYSHVMHLVSHVQGILRKGLDAYDVIAATFPAGTLSGAPKIRAMEIIRELEPAPRGVYGGAVGYISYDGNMDLAITIRTLEIGPDQIAVQAGAGIVYDSDPDKEYAETCHKARGMQKAVALAASGLDLEERGL